MRNQELILLTHVSTESVNDGFLPAARRLGLSPVLLTDQAEAHRQYFSQSGLPAYPEAIIACDVFNPLAVIEAINRRRFFPTEITCKPALPSPPTISGYPARTGM